jgi:carnitine O-acetyltransferase
MSILKDEWTAAKAYFEAHPDATKYRRQRKLAKEQEHSFIRVIRPDGKMKIFAMTHDYIGKGALGKVKTVEVENENGKIYALKIEGAVIDESRIAELKIMAQTNILVGSTKRMLDKNINWMRQKDTKEKNYTVMELLETGLDEKLGPQLSLTERLNYALQAATAIQQLHNAGFIHGDIKADNFRFMNSENTDSEAGHLVPIDFGYSLEVSAKERNKNGEVVGKAHSSGKYTPKEVAQQGRHSYASDIFSLGVMFRDQLKLLRDPVITKMSSEKPDDRGNLDDIIENLRNRLEQQPDYVGVKRPAANKAAPKVAESRAIAPKVVGSGAAARKAVAPKAVAPKAAAPKAAALKAVAPQIVVLKPKAAPSKAGDNLNALKQAVNDLKVFGVKNMQALHEAQQFMREKELNQKNMQELSEKIAKIKSKVNDAKLLDLFQQIDNAAKGIPNVVAAPKPAAVVAPKAQEPLAAPPKAAPFVKPPVVKPALLEVKHPPVQPAAKKFQPPVPKAGHPVAAKAPHPVTHAKKLETKMPPAPAPAPAKVKMADVPKGDNNVLQLREEIANFRTHGVLNINALGQIQNMMAFKQAFDRKTLEELKEKAHGLKGQVARGKDEKLQALLVKIENTAAAAIEALNPPRMKK